MTATALLTGKLLDKHKRPLVGALVVLIPLSGATRDASANEVYAATAVATTNDAGLLLVPGASSTGVPLIVGEQYNFRAAGASNVLPDVVFTMTGALDLADVVPEPVDLPASWHDTLAALDARFDAIPTLVDDAVEEALDGLDIGTGIDPLTQPPVLGRIDIVTAGRAAITSKVTYLDATMTITRVPGVADYFGRIQIRGRGNFTWGLAKKPYKIKTPSKVSLMGMPAFDDWALLANHIDSSKINTALALTIGKMCDGLDWTPGFQYAELYLNGVYQGLYQLTETVKRGSTRVNVDKAGTTGLALTGGYLLEGDIDRETNGDPGWTTTHGVSVIYDDPDGANTTQATYIRGKVQEFEDALFGADWLDPAIGYARFIDRDSFIDHYLIEELASNQEAAWHSSQKFYRTRDSTVPGRFFMGPLWDFDISFGTVVNAAHPSTGFFARSTSTGAGPGATWIIRMFDDPAFRSAVQTRWLALVARLAGVNATIDALLARVAAPTLADAERWGLDSGDWVEQAAFKKQWLAERIAWLTDQFVTPTTAPAKVAGLTGSTTATSVSVAFTALTGQGVSDYVSQYRTGGGAWAPFSDGTSTTPSITVTGLDPETAYDLQVAAVNTVGTGPWSDAITLTTSALVVQPTAYVFDDFNRADSSSLGATPVGSKVWMANADYSINGGTLYFTGANGDGNAWMDSGVHGGDYDISVKLTYLDPASNYPGGLIIHGLKDYGSPVRYVPIQTGGNNFYSSNEDGSTDRIVYDGARRFVSGEVLKVEVRGIESTVYFGDTKIVKFVKNNLDSNIQNGGWIGICGVGGAPARFDDFTVAAPA